VRRQLADPTRQPEREKLDGSPHRAAFVIRGDGEPRGVVEIETTLLLENAEKRFMTGALHILRNFEGLLDCSERD